MFLEQTRNLDAVIKVVIAIVAMFILNAGIALFVDFDYFTTPEFQEPIKSLATDITEQPNFGIEEQLNGVKKIIENSDVAALNTKFYESIAVNLISNCLLGLVLIHLFLPKGLGSVGFTNNSFILYFITFFMASNVAVIGADAMSLNEVLGIDQLQDYLFGTNSFKDAVKMLTEMTFIFPNSERGYLITLIGIALTPAVGEELLFRGVIMNNLKTKTNVHNAIAISALVFALIHFNMTNFFYYFILGVILGYLYYWGRSIVFPIMLHLLNNASVVFSYYYIEHKPPQYDDVAGDLDGVGGLTLLSYVTVAFSLGIFYMNFKRNEILIK